VNQSERLAYWKSVAVEALRARGGIDDAAALEARTWKDEYELFGFFDCFRPDGAGAERVFAGVVGGDAILERLLRIFAATKDGPQRFMYFIVQEPRPATPEELVELTRQHLYKVAQIADDAGDEELFGLLCSRPQIEIKRQPAPVRTQPDLEAPETHIYGICGDWFSELVPTPSDALLLHEAFYSMACFYDLARYLLWPLYVGSTKIVEPFEPYFELWLRGARPIFERPGMVNVYCTNGG
jgi:hypothetical protein